jgi:hypothetical protein
MRRERLTQSNGTRVCSISSGIIYWLVKNTRFKEKTDLQFRAEFFNVANRPHLGLPNTAAGSLQFGQISGTAALPRVLQFALKLRF